MTPERLQWADIVFVMERAHYKPHLGNARVVRLDIPDECDCMGSGHPAPAQGPRAAPSAVGMDAVRPNPQVFVRAGLAYFVLC